MKKLMAVFLCMVMIFSMTSVVFAELGDNPTGIDILNSVDRGFPTTKETGWISEEGTTLYMRSDNDAWLSNSVESWNFVFAKTASKSGNNYVIHYSIYTITFNMTDGKLTSLNISGANKSDINGTYSPQDYKTTTLTYSGPEEYEWTVPSSTNISKDETEITGLAVTKCHLREGNTLKIKIYSDNNFNVKSDANTISYTISKTSGGEVLTNGDIVISTTEATTQSLFAKLSTAGTTPGEYKDRLSFIAEIVTAK